MKKEKRSATIIDVAEKAGVSKATVGRVIGNYGTVSEETRAKVVQAIDQLGYSPNAVAQGLRTKSTKTIGVAVGSIKNNFCNQFLYAVEKVAIGKGYDVLFANSSENEEREFEVLGNLKSRRVDGTILISAVTDVKQIPPKYLSLYTDQPLVLADREIAGLDLDLVTSKNYESAGKAALRLIEAGHRNIGVIYFGQVSTLKDRLAGCKDTLKKHGIKLDRSRVLHAGHLEELSRERIQKFVNADPDMTAVMVFNNSILAQVLRVSRSEEVRPRELSVISWDDDDLNEILEIDTVVQRVEEIGEAAAERLFGIIEAKEKNTDREKMKMTLDTMYVERGSVKKISS